MANLNFQHYFSNHYTVSSVSHDPSGIILICWFGDKKAFIIIINAENSCAAYFFVNHNVFLGLFDEQKV